MFLSIMGSAFVLAVVWQYFPRAAGALARFSFENLLDAISDLSIIDEGVLPVVCFVLGLWILAAALRFIVHLIADLISGNHGSGPQSLGLSRNYVEGQHEDRPATTHGAYSARYRDGR